LVWGVSLSRVVAVLLGVDEIVSLIVSCPRVGIGGQSFLFYRSLGLQHNSRLAVLVAIHRRLLYEAGLNIGQILATRQTQCQMRMVRIVCRLGNHGRIVILIRLQRLTAIQRLFLRDSRVLDVVLKLSYLVVVACCSLQRLLPVVNLGEFDFIFLHDPSLRIVLNGSLRLHVMILLLSSVESPVSQLIRIERKVCIRLLVSH